MFWNFARLVVALATISLTSTRHAEAFAPSCSSGHTALATTTRLQIGVQDTVSLVQTGSQGLLNIVSTAESPADVWTQLPTAVQGAAVAALGVPVVPTFVTLVKSVLQVVGSGKQVKGDLIGNNKRSGYVSYPEGQPATYEMNDSVVPFEFGDAAFVRPLLKQTQLETRPLQVVYDANRDGYDAQVFHRKVDGKGASVVLIKVAGQWCGGYNPRGWASLGQARSSVAAFLFYEKPMFGGWQKVRVSRTGSMACGNDLYDSGIYFGADSLVIPLLEPNRRKVTSRLGQYFEARPDGKLTLMPRASEDFTVQELKVLSGVYAPGEDIPNSGGVLELGYY